MLRLVCTEVLSTYLLPYTLYNTSTGMYEHRIFQDEFATLSQRQTLLPPVQPIRSRGEGVDEAASGRGAQHDNAMRHLA